MSTRTYEGPFDEVEIPALGHLVVKNGEVFEDPDDLLAGQEAIFPTTTTKKSKSASPAADQTPEG